MKTYEKIIVGIWVTCFIGCGIGAAIVAPFVMFMTDTTRFEFLLWGFGGIATTIYCIYTYFNNKKHGWLELNTYDVQIGVYKHLPFIPKWKTVHAKTEEDAIKQVLDMGLPALRAIKLLI
jgi:hypothetical protein